MEDRFMKSNKPSKNIITIDQELLAYRSKETGKMSQEEINQCSKLFSENYGVWSKEGPKPGELIRFSPEMIKKSFVDKPDRFVAMVFYDKDLIGYAFYLRRNIAKKGYLTWILQLVVKKEYRGNHIGAKLMHSIWHLSDSYACGLYTSNPKTIKALEKATMRSVDINYISRNIRYIKESLFDLFPNTSWIDEYKNGMVNTHFYTDHSNISKKIKETYPNHTFPLKTNLPEGYEWLAITFSKQTPYLDSIEDMASLLEFSQSALVDAYSRMKFDEQTWNKHTTAEVDYIASLIDQDNKIIDLGCGDGRITNELGSRGYTCTGIDFSKRKIEIAKSQQSGNVRFFVKDIREFRSEKKYDIVICIYDVVGSFPEEKENLKILETAHKCLQPNGKIIISVMNKEISRNSCSKHGNVIDGIENNIDILLKLKGSNTMQQTGDVFDGKIMIYDSKDDVFYRKEQFFDPDYLPIEYVVRDKRFSKKEIEKLLGKAGFEIDESHYFNAKNISNPLSANNPKAKELFVVAHKVKGRKRLLKKLYWM